MKERPIIFSSEMVRAILEGRKTQTQRVVKPQPAHVDVPWPMGEAHMLWHDVMENPDYYAGCGFCPYGQPGDRLWVRETWRLLPFDVIPNCDKVGVCIDYRADCRKQFYPSRPLQEIRPMWRKHGTAWRPSIHMPRWASRITLKITGIRVERVQDITHEDIEAEGIPKSLCIYRDEEGFKDFDTEEHRFLFEELWNFINAKRGFGWDINPWVWVVEFVRVECE